MFNNIGYSFFIGSLLSFMFEYSQYWNSNAFDLKSTLIRSGVILLFGLALHLCQMLVKESIKENLSIIILIFSIPVITLQFLDYGGKTVWAFPLVIIISAVVFNNKTLLIATSITSIITQRLIWILKPDLLVTVDKYDYITRIGILLLSVSIAFYVHNIYMNKIKENNYQMNFQKINSNLSF